MCSIILFTEATMKILMKCLYLSRKQEKANVGDTILLCLFAQYLGTLSVVRKMSSEGPHILKIIYGANLFGKSIQVLNQLSPEERDVCIFSKIYLHCQEWHLSIQTTCCQLPVCCEMLPAKELRQQESM